MGGAFLRAATICRLLQRHTSTAVADSVNSSPFQQTGAQFRVSHFVRNSRGFEFSPAPFSSAYSSASSASLTTRVGFVGWYLGMVKAKPILTKSITSAIIYTAADLSSQAIAGQFFGGYDFVRTLRMAGYGFIVLGPSLHFWFKLMSRVFPRQDLISTFKKMFMGQATYGPMMTVIFFSSNAYMQGESGTEIVARLKRDLLPTLLNGLMFWPFCDFITFRFIPVHLQPLMSNSFSYLWTIYLTYMASCEKAVMVAS